MTSLVVDGGGGDDSVAVESSSAQELALTDSAGSNSYTIQLGDLAGPVNIADTTATNDVTINGTAGDDLFVVGDGQISSGDQIIQIGAGVRHVTIDAGDGDDQVVVEDPDSSTIPISVVDANQAPVAAADGFSANEDTQLLGNVLSNDADIDAPDLLSVVAVNGQTTAVGQPVETQFGIVTLNSDVPPSTYTPGAGREATSDRSTIRSMMGTAAPQPRPSASRINQDTGVSPAGGILRVGGGAGADVVPRARQPDRQRRRCIPSAGVVEVRIWARGGDDRIDPSLPAIRLF